jgi:hypothetical protein
VFESIPEKSLTIASGATTIGSVGAHPTILLSKTNSYEISQKEKVYLSLYPKKLSSIASGATPIGSAGRAPDEISFFKEKKAKENL